MLSFLENWVAYICDRKVSLFRLFLNRMQNYSRYMKQILLFLYFSITISAFAQAQVAKISGKITVENGTGVDGAILTLKPLGKQIIADEKGNYQFTGIPFGSYTLEVSSMEIVFKTLDVKIDKAVNVFNVTVKAKENKVLNEVSITGKTEKKKMETSGFAVAVIETKEASLRNLTTNELLDRAVGVRVRQNGG
ncbi:MAG: hypothetical protein EOO87_20985, partial [Pedobacter sp.]